MSHFDILFRVTNYTAEHRTISMQVVKQLTVSRYSTVEIQIEIKIF